MIRLAVIGAKQTHWQELTSRLRGVVLQIGSDAVLQQCDAVVFFGPPRADGPGIEHFLDAGKHVLLSAQSCWSSERLQSLSGTARQTKVHLAIANPDRYLPSRQLIRQQLDSGKLGEPGLIRLHRWEPAVADEECEPGIRPVPAALLRDLDLVMWFFGKPPNLVYALEQTAMGVQIHLGFPEGGMALVDHIDHLPSGDGYYSLSLIGSNGAVYADDHQDMQLLYRGGSPLAVRTGEGTLPWSALLQDFVDAINMGRDVSAHVTAWHNVLTVGAAVRQSLLTQQAARPEGLQ